MGKVYVVKKGYSTGIFVDHDWETEVKPMVHGYQGAVFKSFKSLAEAEAYWDNEHIKRHKPTSTIAGKSAQTAETSLLKSAEASSSTSNSGKRKREAENEAILRIYTDGSCLNNGKPNARAGYGVYFGPNDSRNVAARLKNQDQTNNRAELTAIITALELSASYADMVEIHSDSTYCSQGITSWIHGWKRNGWMTASRTAVKNKDLWIRLDKLYNDGGRRDRIKFVWVKGHNGDPGNEAADQLANQGARMDMN